MPPRRRKATRAARRSTGSSATVLQRNLIRQAASNHAYHASGLKNSEQQLRSLGVAQKSSTVQPTSTRTTSGGTKEWVRRIVEEAIVGAVIAA